MVYVKDDYILYHIIAKTAQKWERDIVIYQKTSTLVFRKQTDANIDAETLTLENNGRELEDVFSLPGRKSHLHSLN